MFNPGWFSPEEASFYHIEAVEATKPASSNSATQIAGLLIYADNDGIKQERAIYNTLDFLGDVGGLLDALKFIAGFFIFITGRTGQAQWIIGKLYFWRAKRP